MNWTPDWDNIGTEITATLDDQPLDEDRLAQWGWFASSYSWLPSILICENGYIVILYK